MSFYKPKHISAYIGVDIPYWIRMCVIHQKTIQMCTKKIWIWKVIVTTVLLSCYVNWQVIEKVKLVDIYISVPMLSTKCCIHQDKRGYKMYAQWFLSCVHWLSYVYHFFGGFKHHNRWLTWASFITCHFMWVLSTISKVVYCFNEIE